MKTILVTGGTGFIGNCFCKLLLDERPEYKVINVDVCTYAANPSTIEEELRHYRKYFKDKIVFCNCDDPYESNFFKYFDFYTLFQVFYPTQNSRVNLCLCRKFI